MRMLVTSLFFGLALVSVVLPFAAEGQGFGSDVLFGGPSRGASGKSPDVEPLMRSVGKVGGESFLVRLNIDPEQGIVVGQPVRLSIDVLTPSGFGRAAAAPELDVPDAITIQTQQSAARVSTQEGETRYTGQRWRYLMYPRRAGEFVIPPTEVKVELLERGKAVASEQLVLAEGRFRTIMPEEAAAAGLTSLISTRELHFSQVIDRKLTGLMVGDAVKRTISISAPDTTGMLFPPLKQEPLDGISIYPDQPRVQDGATRGGYSGKRVETLTYVFEKEGNYTLPGIELHWWNLEKNRLEKESLDALEIEVAPNPAWVASQEGLEEGEDIEVELGFFASMLRFLGRRWFLIVGSIALGGLFYWLLRPRWARFINELAAARHRRADSEAAFFRHFRRACRTGDPHLTLRQFMRWLDRVESGPQPATLAGFAAWDSDPLLGTEIDRLVEIVCGSVDDLSAAKPWSGRKLIASVKHARKKRRKVSREENSSRVLPPMNPSSPLESRVIEK